MYKKLTSMNVGLIRELQAILTLYMGTVLSGFNMGFSAVTIPDIKQEWVMSGNNSSSFIPAIQASDEELSWFGKNITAQHFKTVIILFQLVLLI